VGSDLVPVGEDLEYLLGAQFLQRVPGADLRGLYVAAYERPAVKGVDRGADLRVAVGHRRRR